MINYCERWRNAVHPIIAETSLESPFKLQRLSVKGEGLRPELRDAPWEKIREMIYEGRGG